MLIRNRWDLCFPEHLTTKIRLFCLKTRFVPARAILLRHCDHSPGSELRELDLLRSVTEFQRIFNAS